MRKVSLFIFMLLFSLAALGQKKARTKPEELISDPAKEGFIKATVIKYEVENCGFLLQVNGKTKKDPKIKLQPENMAEEFKKNKLKVWVKYVVPKTQPMTTCMAGQVVKVEAMKIRK
ncbi:MAG: hypothetical protein ACJ76F_03915 [Bacteroidia bacterium]